MNDTNQTVSESKMVECQFHNNCGGWCETRRELEHNLCDHCLEAHDEEMQVPAVQKGEPVLWRYRKTTTRSWFYTEHKRGAEIAKTDGYIVQPFFAHADPGEVERLREVIKHSDANILRQSQRIDNLKREVAELRSQLAERDMLLRDCFTAMLKGGYSKPLRERIKTALSASTEREARHD